MRKVPLPDAGNIGIYLQRSDGIQRIKPDCERATPIAVDVLFYLNHKSTIYVTICQVNPLPVFLGIAQYAPVCFVGAVTTLLIELLTEEMPSALQREAAAQW
ncbi:MAG: hypothetical protein ACK5XX_00460, partial [Holosporales bacterium]